MPRYLKTSNACNIRGPLYRRRMGHTDAGVPLLLHSSGTPCWPLTDWMIWLFKNAHRKPGTLCTYADQLSLFLDYLDSRHLELEDTTDQILIQFRNCLLEDAGRSNNQINAILRRVFRALLFLQRGSYFSTQVVTVDEDSGAVRLSSIQHNIATARGHKGQKSFNHAALIPDNTPARRYPIAEKTIDALWNAAAKLNNPARRERAELLLLLLETTGNRRVEVQSITIQAIEHAQRTNQLEVEVAKSPNGQVRIVRIPREVSIKAKQYMQTFRQEAIKEGIRRGLFERDHGYLLVAENGRPWAKKSINAEFDVLRAMGDIAENVHPHLFRHRWITTTAANMVANPDTPTARSGIEARLMTLTGHRSRAGVADYIDLAFEELGLWRSSEHLAHQEAKNTAHSRLEGSIMDRLDHCSDDAEMLRLARELRDLRQSDGASE